MMCRRQCQVPLGQLPSQRARTAARPRCPTAAVRQAQTYPVKVPRTPALFLPHGGHDAINTLDMVENRAQSLGEFSLLNHLMATPIGVVLADFDGRLLFANQAFRSMLGFTEEEIRSKNWNELSPPEDAGKEQTLFAQLRMRSAYHYHSDKRCVRRDGSLFVGHWSVWLLGDHATPLVLAMITDQGQADFARRETEEHFRYLANRIPVMIWTSGADGLCSYTTQRWLEFTGRSLKEQLGYGWADGIHPGDRQQWLESYKRAFDQRESLEMEYRLRRYDGEYRWVLSSGVPRFSPAGSFAGYIGSVIDITELKVAMATLGESEERFRLVANTAPVMIWMSGTDKLCTYFNHRWLQFTGRSFEQEQGNGWAEGVHSEDLERCWNTYAKAFDRREPFQMEYRLRRQDGEYRWVLDQGVARFNADGSFAGYIGSCIDVTERKLAEEALSTVSQKLIQAQEEERTRLARELHDDINQRLALVVINLERLKQGLPTSETELRQQIGAASKEISDLGVDLSALSHRLHSSKLDLLGLAAAASSVCRELSERLGVGIEFNSENIPTQLPEEISHCLYRVLQEALQNAIKHSGSRNLQVSLTGRTSEIELTVCDAGIGFDPEEAMKGRGIGLTSIRERLKLVNGILSIDSQPQRGTTIHARVPLSSRMKSVTASG